MALTDRRPDPCRSSGHRSRSEVGAGPRRHPHPHRRPRLHRRPHLHRMVELAPGVVLAVLGTAVAGAVASRVEPLSALVVAVVLGAVIGNTVVGRGPVDVQPGLTIMAKRVLRVGVVLLGLRLSFGDVFGLGPSLLIVVALTVTATFFGVQWLARRMGLPPSLGLLVATGYSICGASAIAAVEDSAEAEEEEVAAAVGLVTLFGSLAIAVLPTLAALLGLTDHQFAVWAGASVHDVAQVVATASSGGETVVAQAMVVKLTRVALLAPIVLGVSLRRRATAKATFEIGPVTGTEASPASTHGLPPILPLFVVGFLAMVALRTSDLVPAGVLDGARTLEGWALAAALVGLGSGVRLSSLRRLGPAPILLGAVAWLVVGSVSLVGIALTT